MSISAFSPLALAASLLAGAAALSVPAQAGNTDLTVLPGIGPQAAAGPARSHLGPPAANLAPYAYGSGRAAPGRQVAANGYGGGFLEMVITGRDPTPRRGETRYNRPQEPGRAVPVRLAPPPHAYAPEPAAEPAPPVRRVAYAPASLAAHPVGRAVDPMYLRQEVAYAGGQAPGTVVIDTTKRFLYLVQPGGRAMRYGIGVGRPGFEWAGVKTVTRKAEWPDWTPPPEMRKRRPDLPAFMKGGPENPLGARAMYLGSSLYRIHGTNEPWTIGQNVSSGCIRLMNEDVTDLYGRVRVGSKVIVM
ncbi:MAG: hypothetical protein JWN93_3925 [Hyphomicrobiales bacterium]|jgi:lipoprotein-anchoring transpeptidase ErfK/SrfK|nr:hypothetical protein [Hyphomicrobiales bacterium]